MRRLVFLSLFIASSAFAQSRNTLSVFVSNLSYTYSTNSGSATEGGFGVGYERQLRPNLSAVISAAVEKYKLRDAAVPRQYRIVPVDALVRYHFLSGRAVSPYVGGGARYLRKPDIAFASNRLTLEAVAGADFRVTQKIGIFVDVKRLLASPVPKYDPQTKVATGVRIRF
jgi:hypothetical protein